MSSATKQTSHGPENTAGVRFGPLNIDNRKFNEYGMFHISNGHYIVGHALGQMPSCEFEAMQYARLFAAAPDLLEALIGLLVSRDDEAVAQAQAAIKKAEGR